jgi:hypothetical protein
VKQMLLSSGMRVRWYAIALIVAAWPLLVPRTSEAQRRGGGGARGGGRSTGGGAGSIGARSGGARTSSGGGNRLSGGYGGAARTSVNRDFGNASVNRNTNVNRNINNANVNRNVNVDRNYDVDVDVDHGWDWHPVATGAAVAAGAALTAAAIGSVVYTLPPSCSVVVVGGISYQHCGSTWYEPQFSGTSVSYIVVGEPH